MPLPLIPIILGGASIAAAAHGVKKGVDAKNDMDAAKSMSRKAQNIADSAEKMVKEAKESAQNAIENLGKQKIIILSGSINDFVKNFEKIKHMDLENSPGLDELRNFNPQSPEFKQLKEASFEAKDIAVNGIGALGGGALLAFGTYNVVMGGLGGLLVTATTGTALSSLTGVAATNATLAWLGGGALTAGGLGMAGGMAVLGGLVAGPALALGGSMLAKQADKAYWDAKSNLDKAKEFEEQAKNIKSVLEAIQRRAEQLKGLLIGLDMPFTSLVADLRSIIYECGTDYRTYTQNDKQQIYKCAQLAKMIKTVLDTSLLNEDGNLTKESENSYNNGQMFLAEHTFTARKNSGIAYIEPAKKVAVGKMNSHVKQITETYEQSLGSKPGVMKITLDSAGLWPEAICRYAVYLFDKKSSSIEWHNLNADGLSVDIDKFTHIIFCALQKESTNAWENVLFQTALIKLPQFAKAEFKLTGMDTNQGNKFVGKWVNIQSFVAETPKKEDKVMTFNSAGLWPEAICRYAAYFTDKNNSAHSAWHDVEADGKVVILEDGYTDVIFCGLPKNEKKNSFANAIFRTGNIELPKASGAVYKLTNVDVSDNNKYVGEWQNTNVAPPQKNKY